MNIILAVFLFFVFYCFGIFTACLFAGAKISLLEEERDDLEHQLREKRRQVEGLWSELHKRKQKGPATSSVKRDSRD
jgi:hypothetical protein